MEALNRCEDADICLRVHGQVWPADLEAGSGTHFRVRLRVRGLGVLPRWDAGTVADCTIGEGGRTTYFGEARLLKQVNRILWISIPAVWRQGERRGAARSGDRFKVEFRGHDRKGVGACIDLSPGGFRVKAEEPLSRWTSLTLEFMLPGDTRPIRTEGMVLWTSPSEDSPGYHEAGIKFMRLLPQDGLRIANHLNIA